MTVHDVVLAKPTSPAASADVQSIFTFRGAAPDVRRIAMVGTYTPRKCGIATFGNDIVEKLAEFHPNIAVDVYALDDRAAPLAYDGVAGTIAFDDPEAYLAAARRINESGVDAVWLQHEYGIFGGPDGEMVCDFVDRLAAPVILTPHTVLTDPSERQRAILDHLVTRASRIMTMSRHSCQLLGDKYHAPARAAADHPARRARPPVRPLRAVQGAHGASPARTC
jgi:hypothetical protein